MHTEPTKLSDESYDRTIFGLNKIRAKGERKIREERKLYCKYVLKFVIWMNLFPTIRR